MVLDSKVASSRDNGLDLGKLAEVRLEGPAESATDSEDLLRTLQVLTMRVEMSCLHSSDEVVQGANILDF